MLPGVTKQTVIHLLPYAVLLAAITAFSPDEPWRAAVFASELALALLVLVDWRVARGFALKRVSALLRSFMVLLAVSLCAGWIFFRPSAEVWKETRVQSPQAAP